MSNVSSRCSYGSEAHGELPWEGHATSEITSVKYTRGEPAPSMQILCHGYTSTLSPWRLLTPTGSPNPAKRQWHWAGTSMVAGLDSTLAPLTEKSRRSWTAR